MFEKNATVGDQVVKMYPIKLKRRGGEGKGDQQSGI